MGGGGGTSHLYESVDSSRYASPLVSKKHICRKLAKNKGAMGFSSLSFNFPLRLMQHEIKLSRGILKWYVSNFSAAIL